jgi:hypothetical protein
MPRSAGSSWHAVVDLALDRRQPGSAPVFQLQHALPHDAIDARAFARASGVSIEHVKSSGRMSDD